MGTRAGYITVDWEKVEDDMQDAGQIIQQKLVEEQNNGRTRRIVENVRLNIQYGNEILSFDAGMLEKLYCLHKLVQN